MGFHRELVKMPDGKRHPILGLVAGNIATLSHHEKSITFDVDGMQVTLVYGRTPKLAAEQMEKAKRGPAGA